MSFALQRWSIPCCSDNGDIELPEEFRAENGSPVILSVAESDCYEELIETLDENEEIVGDAEPLQ